MAPFVCVLVIDILLMLRRIFLPSWSGAVGELGLMESRDRIGDECAATLTAPESGTLHLVRVSELRDALAGKAADEVRQDLFSSANSLLQRSVEITDDVNFALISYRQVRSEPDDGCTLDQEALLAIAASASASGAEYVWLDAWCYRQDGDYVHAEFCRTLAMVALRARAVIWLPTARRHAAPSYPFRLWCTFEATVVHERNLPVYIAGDGLHLTLKLLAKYGPMLAALPGVPPPAELRALAYFNAIMVMWCFIYGPWHMIFWKVMFEGEALGSASSLLARQIRLGKSGQYVVRTMLNHAVSEPPAGRREEPRQGLVSPRGAWTSISSRVFAGRRRRQSVEHRKSANRLSKGLPWLPAYDRRDAIAVRQTLDQLAGRVTSPEDLWALAFSAYASASLLPSPGDAVEGRSLRAWLQEKNMDGVLADATVGAAWADAGESSVRSGSDAAILPFAALTKFGWFAQRGASCLLVTPAGSFLAAQPSGWRWDAQRLKPVTSERAQADVRLLMGTALLMLLGVLSFNVGIIMSLHLWDPAPLRWGFVGLTGFLILATALCLNPLVLLTPIRFSVQFGAVPHLPDFYKKLSPMGYSLKGLLFMQAVTWWVPTCFTLITWMVAKLERWPDLGYPLGSFSFKALTHGPGELLLIYSCVVFSAVWNVRLISMSVSAAFHMWYRAGRSGFPYTFHGMDDARFGYFGNEEGERSATHANAKSHTVSQGPTV